MIKYYFRIAIDSVGDDYLDAEQQLLAQGQAAVAFLQGRLPHLVGLSKLITQVILDRIAGNPNFQSCLDYFDQVERRAAQTPIGVPPPESVATYLIQHFDDTVAPLLGVYLVKLEQVWPAWKTLATILYLGQLSSTAAADVLIRFITATTNEHARTLAVQSLVAVGDASVLTKIETELKPLAAACTALQQSLDQIRASLKS